jgi:hypothetical protein
VARAVHISWELLLADRLGPIAVLACAPDGDFFVATSHAAQGAERGDRIYRIELR